MEPQINVGIQTFRGLNANLEYCKAGYRFTGGKGAMVSL